MATRSSAWSAVCSGATRSRKCSTGALNCGRRRWARRLSIARCRATVAVQPRNPSQSPANPPRSRALHDLDGERPRVTYRDAAGVEHELAGSYVAGCDGFHGVSRRSIPDGVLTTYSFDHGIGWYTVLADAPPPRYPLMGVSSLGFAAHFARGPRASRFYLQYRTGEDPRGWSDELTWGQLRQRLGDGALPDGPITDREIVEMRSFVVEPMAYGRLFLAGDAAHIITPMGAKGMNLALADAYALARALTAAERGGDDGPLRGYSALCLRRTWDYQEFSRWFTEMVHDAGDDSAGGPFRRKLATARLDRLFSSPPAAAAFADLMAGTEFTAEP